MAKIRVAPLKIVGREKPTIPLMELMAALLGVQLATTIINAMKKARVDITEVTMWCDNQPVLFWIDELEPNKCKVIRNRVNKIQSFTRQYQAAWRYVPTDQNPADLLTRGIDLEQFSSSKLWKFGPDWLSNSSAWPKWSISQIKRPQVLVLPSPSLNESDVSPSKKPDVSAIIEPSRHRWSSLLRVTAVTQRVCKNFELKWKKQPTIEGPITSSELLAAEVKWIRSVQQRFLSLELEYLQGDKRGRCSQLVSNLDLFLDKDQIIRCCGRLQNSSLSEGAKHPILIPKQSILEDLIIQSHHERMLHGGANTTVCSIRQRFWICSIRQQVKSVLRRCATCRKYTGKAYKATDHAPLPDFRVNYSHPFTYTGIDLTGAITVRDPRLLEDSKAYIALFTCAATRALQLQVVEDLTSDELLQAIRQFASHHSIPKKFLTDNATNFEGAANILKMLLSSPEISMYFSNHNIDWDFIPKRGPWYGGFWERLIGLTKECLVKMVGRTKLTPAELRTIVAEIEAVLNDRPLMQASPSVEEEDALTPSHLCYGKRLTCLPYAAAEQQDDPDYGVTATDLTRHLALRRNVLIAFQKRFSNDYLVALREFHQATASQHK